jgi:hypothetical protein
MSNCFYSAIHRVFVSRQSPWGHPIFFLSREKSKKKIKPLKTTDYK